MRHFEYYPQIEYGDQLLTNIMVRGKIRDAVLNQSFIFYKYTIKDSDRPDILAHKYYGNATYTWAIFYANNIFDPLDEWPRDQDQFNRYIKGKYGSVELAMFNPHHYLLKDENNAGVTWEIDLATYEDVNIPANLKKMVTIYEYEQELNDRRRDIKIVDKIYIKQLVNELTNLFK